MASRIFLPGRRWTPSRILSAVTFSFFVLILLIYIISQPTAWARERLDIENELLRLRIDVSSRNKELEKGIVLARTKQEYIGWLLPTCRDLHFTPYVYSMDSRPAPGHLIPRTRQGRETAAYLSYIIDHYDKLPKYTFFIHAKEEQWHNDVFGSPTTGILHGFRYEAVDAAGYVNLRCSHYPGCPNSVSPMHPTQQDIDSHDTRAFFGDIYMEIFGVTKDQIPESIGHTCCGQFVVTRERIRQRPREDYERMMHWVMTTNVDSFGIGWVFEMQWHIVFGMDPVWCPNYEQCRCDSYGWCGPLPSGDVLTPVGWTNASSHR